jgi:hypothetical protein
MPKITTTYKIQNPSLFSESAESAQMSVTEKIDLVKRHVYSTLSNKGFFMFHLYRDDVINDVSIEIVNDFENYGKTKPINIYCNKAYQFSLTKQRYYTAKKRQPFFTAQSLDTPIRLNGDKGEMSLYDILPAKKDYAVETHLLLNDIKKLFGVEILELTIKILEGEKPSAEELCVLRATKGFKEYLTF